jgi:hypothetical protein
MRWLVIGRNHFGDVSWAIDRSVCMAIDGLVGVVLGW